MVIYNLDILGVTVRPPEADTPLVVDPNAMLISTFTFQQFKPVIRWSPEIGEDYSSMYLNQLAQCRSLDLEGQLL